MFKLTTLDFTTIDEALKDESKNFDFLRKVFDRVCTLYVRDLSDDKNFAKQIVEDKFKEQSINEMVEVIRNYSDHILDTSKAVDFEVEALNDHELEKILLLNYFTISTILKAYRHCRQAENRDKNSLNRIIFGEDNHNYLIDVIDSLAMLEDITSRNYTSEVVRHFVEKAVEKTTKQERQAQSKGGQERAKKYEEQKNIIFEEWEKGSFHSYAACARHFANQLGLSTKTIENWLSENYSQTKKKI